MPEFKFTVIWGNIGDDPGKRLDHVTVEKPDFASIMDAAFQLVYNEWNDNPDAIAAGEPEFLWEKLRHNTQYDGYAILDGHLTDSPHASFT